MECSPAPFNNMLSLTLPRSSEWHFANARIECQQAVLFIVFGQEENWSCSQRLAEQAGDNVLLRFDHDALTGALQPGSQLQEETLSLYCFYSHSSIRLKLPKSSKCQVAKQHGQDDEQKTIQTVWELADKNSFKMLIVS